MWLVFWLHQKLFVANTFHYGVMFLVLISFNWKLYSNFDGKYLRTFHVTIEFIRTSQLFSNKSVHMHRYIETLKFTPQINEFKTVRCTCTIYAKCYFRSYVVCNVCVINFAVVAVKTVQFSAWILHADIMWYIACYMLLKWRWTSIKLIVHFNRRDMPKPPF